MVSTARHKVTQMTFNMSHYQSHQYISERKEKQIFSDSQVTDK